MRTRNQRRQVADIYFGINKNYPFRVERAWTCGDGKLTNGTLTVPPGRRGETDLSVIFNLTEIRSLHAATLSVHRDDVLRELHEIAEKMRAEHDK